MVSHGNLGTRDVADTSILNKWFPEEFSVIFADDSDQGFSEVFVNTI